jgi:hypothetical protein
MHTVRVVEESSSVWVSNGDHAMKCSFSRFCASLGEADLFTASANELNSAVGTCLQKAAGDPSVALNLPNDTLALGARELGRLAREGRLPDVSVIKE